MVAKNVDRPLHTGFLFRLPKMLSLNRADEYVLFGGNMVLLPALAPFRTIRDSE